MTSSYLYYDRNGEWVRVNADAYSRIVSGAPLGQCSTIYRVTFKATYFRSFNRTLNFTFNNLNGPLTGFEAYIQNGNCWARVRANGAWVNNNSGISGNSVVQQPFDIVITRSDGQPDNCGVGSCQTRFTLNGQQTLTLPTCPEISDGRGCRDCCRELLPLLRSIHV
jgi:hypothetical protein